MNSSLRERFERLGPVRAVDRVSSGSPAEFVLQKVPDRQAVATVTAALALARRGMTLLGAKRAMEDMLAHGRTFVAVPVVEDVALLVAELAETGVTARKLGDEEAVDVKAIRERLALTQEQFALRLGLDVDAVRNWEHGRRKPDRAARSYLRVIAREPALVEDALTAG